MSLSVAEREARFHACVRGWAFNDLRGAEFQRLLHLAHDEGLIPELLRDTRYRDRRLAECRPADVGLALQPEGTWKSTHWVAFAGSAASAYRMWTAVAVTLVAINFMIH